MHKIAIIWPAFPYRWGIAHHTNQLINAFLQQNQNVFLFTFSRQYPWLLYPGKKQTEPEGTPNPLSKSSLLSTHRILDTINPFSWYRTARQIIQNKPNYCLIKYWHPYFVPCFTFIAWLLRRNKIPVICIIDNLFPHERHRGDTLLARIFFTQVDRAVTQSDIVHQQFHLSFPNIPEIMIPHPLYDQFWFRVELKEARWILQIPDNKKLLLFFWFIRLYKGLDLLLLIMPRLIVRFPNIHLLIAWECFGDFKIYQKIIDNLCLSEYITLHLKYIPNSDIPIYFGASDLLVMPYRHITNSGIENIGKVYANNMLLTVWISWDILLENIIRALSTPSSLNWESINWGSYCMSLNNFLYK